MQQGDLRIGKRYILNIASKPVAVYEGKHDGQLALADGSTYYGEPNALRFRYTDKDGVERIALFDTAREVVEPEDAKVERQREEVARAARMEAATTEAKAYLTSLGLTAYESREWWSLSDEARANGVVISSKKESADEIELDRLSIGHLRRILSR